MVFTLILILAAIVFLAFFVGKNLTNTCTFWLFKTFEKLPVSMLVLIAFGAGIVFSILVVLIYKLRQPVSSADVDYEVSKRMKKEQQKKAKLEKKAILLKKKELRNKKSVLSANNDDKTIVQE